MSMLRLMVRLKIKRGETQKSDHPTNKTKFHKYQSWFYKSGFTVNINENYSSSKFDKLYTAIHRIIEGLQMDKAYFLEVFLYTRRRFTL